MAFLEVDVRMRVTTCLKISKPFIAVRYEKEFNHDDVVEWITSKGWEKTGGNGHFITIKTKHRYTVSVHEKEWIVYNPRKNQFLAYTEEQFNKKFMPVEVRG